MQQKTRHIIQNTTKRETKNKKAKTAIKHKTQQHETNKNTQKSTT